MSLQKANLVIMILIWHKLRRLNWRKRLVKIFLLRFISSDIVIYNLHKKPSLSNVADLSLLVWYNTLKESDAFSEMDH